MNRKFAIAAAVGAAAVIGVTGTALAAAADDSPSRSAGPAETFTSDGTAPSASAPSSSESFRGDGSLDDNSSPSPSESFRTAEPGSVTPAPRRSSSSGPGDVSPRSSSPTSTAPISAAQARVKALATVGGGRVTKVEAETEHGRSIWEVEVYYQGIEHDLDIDRKTGAVTDHDTDRSDDHGSDDRHGRGSDDRHGDDRGSDDRHGDDRGSDNNRGRGSDD